MNNRSGNLWDANSEWWFANISENNFQEYSEIILPLSIQLLAKKSSFLISELEQELLRKKFLKTPHKQSLAWISH